MLRLTVAAFFLGPALGGLLLGVLALFIERKLIGIAQKRLGISFLGRNGWAHLPADLVKFWLKHTARHQGLWLSTGAGVGVALLGYLNWSLLGLVFFSMDRGESFLEAWEFQLLAYFAYANLTTLYMFGVVVGTKSKYATLAAARLLLVSVYLEVGFLVFFLLVYLHIGGFTFGDLHSVVGVQGGLATSLPPVGLVFVLYSLFEAKRAPFDHSEAESELVAGHLVEYGGRALLFFYLAEYVHFLMCIFLVWVLVCGGGGVLVVGAGWPYWALGLGVV